METPMTDQGRRETERAGYAYVRNVAAVEAAVARGQFNLAKVLRAAAHAQRLLAIDRAREQHWRETPASLLEATARELRSMELAGAAASVRSSILGIVERSLASLRANPDVLESDVAQSLWGCRVRGFVAEGDQPESCELCGALAPEFDWFGPFFFAKTGSLLPAQSLEILASAPAEVAEALDGVDEFRAGQRPSRDEWSVKETLAHMLETDLLFASRVKFLLDPGQAGSLPRPRPPWKLHEGKGYETWPAAALVRRHGEVRRKTMELLGTLTVADWAREKSGTTINELANWLAQHEIGHTQQLKRLCGKPLRTHSPRLRSS
jgi:rubrerythrin